MLHCPRCHIPIVDLHESGYSDGVCATCKYHFGALTGTLQSKSSRQVTLKRQTSKQDGTYQRHYEFRILRNAHELEVVNLHIPGKDDLIRVQKGDHITLMFTLRHGKVEEYLSVFNHTTGEVFKLAKPGDASKATARKVAIFLALVTFVLLVFHKGEHPGLTFFGPLVVGFAAYFGLSALFQPKAVLNTEQSNKIQETQTLLAQKSALIRKRQELSQHTSTRLGLLQNLKRTQAKMHSVDPALYASRLSNLQAAINGLEALNQTEQTLIERYDKAITLFEIELESLSLSEHLASDVLTAIELRIADIEAMEHLTQDMTLQLEANEEVAALLKAKGTV